MNTPEYIAEINSMIARFEVAYQDVDAKRKEILDSEAQDLDAVDWSTILQQMRNMIWQLICMREQYKFNRVSLAQFNTLLNANALGRSVGASIYDQEYTITDLDTLRTVELKTGIPWADLLDYNETTPSAWKALKTLRIPVNQRASVPNYSDVFVVGSNSGTDIYGKDLPAELLAGADGDLTVLTPEETIVQVVTILTNYSKGSFPYYEWLGIEKRISESYPKEARDSAYQLKIVEALQVDPRIKSVEITGVRTEQNTKSFTVLIGLITGQQISTRV